jgi:hypothetical protein
MARVFGSGQRVPDALESVRIRLQFVGALRATDQRSEGLGIQ